MNIFNLDISLLRRYNENLWILNSLKNTIKNNERTPNKNFYIILTL